MLYSEAQRIYKMVRGEIHAEPNNPHSPWSQVELLTRLKEAENFFRFHENLEALNIIMEK